ncbi:MAG: ABC transporter permease subunit [Ruminiclostridium sp.]|nr:ABC transporter permease subunit [Ruminiclostridium sp.]
MLQSKTNWKRNLFIIGALIPPLLVSLGMVIYPIIQTVIQSFQDPETKAWTFANYVYLFTEKVPKAAIWYTFENAVLTVFLSVSISYLLALYMRFSDSKISKLVGNLYLLPRFIPSLVAVYAMCTIVKDSGLIYRLSLLLPETSKLHGFKPGMLYNMKGIQFMNLWFNIPFATMIIVAALSGIPESIIESARDIGAGKLRVFFQFILPLSYKDVLIAVTFVFMSNISSFTTPYIIGPNHPQFLGVYLRKLFSNMEYELAAAVSVVIFLFSSASAFVYLYTNMKEQAWESRG